MRSSLYELISNCCNHIGKQYAIFPVTLVRALSKIKGMLLVPENAICANIFLDYP